MKAQSAHIKDGRKALMIVDPQIDFITGALPVPGAAGRIDKLIEDGRVERIDICGLAGDVCVRSTAEDAAERYGCKMIKILKQYSPSLDGGEALAYFEGKMSCDK